MLDASNNVIAKARPTCSGIGQGPDISLAGSHQRRLRSATGLVSPQQVAADFAGNSYIADSGQGKVLLFAPGAAPTCGCPGRSGLHGTHRRRGRWFRRCLYRRLRQGHGNSLRERRAQHRRPGHAAERARVRTSSWPSMVLATSLSPIPDNARVVKISNALDSSDRERRCHRRLRLQQAFGDRDRQRRQRLRSRWQQPCPRSSPPSWRARTAITNSLAAPGHRPGGRPVRLG